MIDMLLFFLILSYSSLPVVILIFLSSEIGEPFIPYSFKCLTILTVLL